MIDEGMAVWFPGPSSFTGEDCAEFHVHGSVAVVAAMYNALGMFPDCRPAEAGEFTQRAFLNGRLDLTQAEALADLIEAETESQRVQALENSLGRQSQLFDAWRRSLVTLRAELESRIDFSDEDDVPFDVDVSFLERIEDLIGQFVRFVDGFRTAELVREGFKVVLTGPPNAGKSSLLNALAKRDVAIVSAEPGTTRDLLEVRLNLDGALVTLTDTAGIRAAAAGSVEAIGIERARAAVENADLVVRLCPIDCDGTPKDSADTHSVLHITSKCDLASEALTDRPMSVSSITGHGIDVLLAELSARAKVLGRNASGVLPTRERHVQLTNAAVRELRQVPLSLSVDLGLAADHLRIACERISALIGKVDVENVLGDIFSRFCVGK
jgi:tRNA modification GTPase